MFKIKHCKLDQLFKRHRCDSEIGQSFVMKTTDSPFNKRQTVPLIKNSNHLNKLKEY